MLNLLRNMTQPAKSPGPSKSHGRRNLAILVVVLVVLALAAFLSLGGNSGGLGGTGVGATTHTINIVNGVQTVNAHDYQAYSINVPSGATSVSVQGSFTASGGSGNDIIVLILDAASYTNWQNGHSVNAYYNSGQLTTSSFDVPLPSGSGTYYLVYSNEFSLISQKSVNTQANLIYTA